MYNIKAQLLSLQRAHATGCWVGMGQEPTRCPMAQVLMTPMALSKQAMLSRSTFWSARAQLFLHGLAWGALQPFECAARCSPPPMGRPLSALCG
jgi:hypothetical protein